MKKLALLLASLPFFASAGLFKLTYTGGNLTANQARPILDQMEEEVNKNLPSADSKDEYFKGMTTASEMAAAGVTSSYGTVFKRFLVGVSASGGAHLGSKSWSDFSDLGKNPEQFRGFGVQAALIAGANVGRLLGSQPGGRIDLNRLKVYLSGFALNKKIGDVTADYFGLGLASQYRVFEETNWLGRSLKWTGLDIGFGILYSRLDMDATVNLNKAYSVQNGGNTYTGTFAGSALFNAKVSTLVMPIEVSTGLRIAYFLKLIAGLGVDVNLGKTTGYGTLSSNSLDVEQTGGGGGPEITSTAAMDVNGSSAGDILNVRIFAGPHIEFGIGSIFVNVNKSLLENAISANTGVNFFW
jgi:hypothetical protein